MVKPTTQQVSVIDLHCDTITECFARGICLEDDALAFSLNKIPQQYRYCQCMAIFMPDKYRGQDAIDYFDSVYCTFKMQLEKYTQRITQITNLQSISEETKLGKLGVILTVEGGSALAGQIERVDKLWDLGVKILTLTWNGANEICGGAFTNDGFTTFGRNVVARMQQLGMAVDVSHLSDKGFYQLCEFAQEPLVATHSNARSICDSPRNLTDDMFTIIAKNNGVVGLNYYTNFIKKDGNTKSIDDLLHHLHHFLALGGQDTVALGSDFDGADMPDYLGSVDKIEHLVLAMEKSGLSTGVVNKVLFENANSYLSRLAGG